MEKEKIQRYIPYKIIEFYDKYGNDFENSPLEVGADIFITETLSSSEATEIFNECKEIIDEKYNRVFQYAGVLIIEMDECYKVMVIDVGELFYAGYKLRKELWGNAHVPLDFLSEMCEGKTFDEIQDKWDDME